MGMIQADFFGSFDLDDAGIVNDNLYDAEAQGSDLLPDQLQPGAVVALCARRAYFISQIHTRCSINQTENSINLHYVNRDINILFMFVIKDLGKSVVLFVRECKY